MKLDVSPTLRQDFNIALECSPAWSDILFSLSYRSILEAKLPTANKGVYVGPAAWGTSTQTPTMRHGFWVRLSASNALPGVWQFCLLYFLEELLYRTISTCSCCGLKFNTRICSYAPWACIWRWTWRVYPTIEMGPYFSGVILPEAEAWPW